MFARAYMFANRILFISYSVFTRSVEKSSVSFAYVWWLAAGTTKFDLQFA